MIAWIVLSIGIGALIGMAILATINRATAPKTPPSSGGISVIGCDMSGRGPAEINPRYGQMVADVLKQPATESGFRNLLP
jgi:hypothetical protein